MSSEVEARVAIDHLVRQYADAVTRRDFGGFDRLFAPTCTVTLDLRSGEPVEFCGGPAIGEFIEQAIARFDFFVFSILNSVVTAVDVAAGTAHGRMYICEHRHEPATGADAPATYSQAFGLYQDRYARSGRGWVFAERRYASIGRNFGTHFESFPIP